MQPDRNYGKNQDRGGGRGGRGGGPKPNTDFGGGKSQIVPCSVNYFKMHS